MSKKATFIGIVIMSILCFSTVSYAEQYYDQYPGYGFQPQLPSSTYVKDAWGFIFHDDTDDAAYFCPVNISVPDGSIYFIKSIGMRFKDNLGDGYIAVSLMRQNLYTGNSHIVASWASGLLEASDSEQTASKGTEPGVKLVDTKKFAYWLCVGFIRLGDVNPSHQLRLYQVRIHYGT